MGSRANSLLNSALRQLQAASQRATPLQPISTNLARPVRNNTIFQPLFARAIHPIPRPTRPSPSKPVDSQPEDSSGDGPKSEGKRPAATNPAYYQLSFTCLPCGHRSHHNVSKQGYHHGSTLIACPECRNRHVISDHLGIFGEESITIEDLMKRKGQLLKRGTLGEDGDIEFWPEEAYDQQGPEAKSS